MCLYDKKRFRFTIFPIHCYKYFRIDNNQLRNYFRNTLVISKAMFPESLSFPYKNDEGMYEFGAGFIHAMRQKPIYPVILCLECIIPPFTRYAIGESGDICARRMKIISSNYVFN